MFGLVGKKSTLRQLSLALNGTIKNKVEGKELGYSECDPVCTEDQLVAIQLVTGWLSKAPLMGSLSLNKLTHQMNSSYPRPVEYLEFCSGRADLRCIDPANAVATFAKMTYNNFTEMVKIVANMDNPDLVENLFRIENPQKDGAYGESLIAYMFYLQNQVFNPYQEDTDSTDFQVYKLIFPSYEYLVSTLDYLQTAIPLEVISRAAISAVQTGTPPPTQPASPAMTSSLLSTSPSNTSATKETPIPPRKLLCDCSSRPTCSSSQQGSPSSTSLG